jgi:cholesterol transport system auxiliary component
MRARKGITRILMATAAVFLLVTCIAGCISRGKPSPMIDYYVFEYPAPTHSALAPIDQVVKVERFSVAKVFNSATMVYRPAPYRMDAYGSNRWMVNPGDMMSDYLLRDMRSSGLFRGVLSFRDYEDARFLLTGNVEEIMEVDEDTNRKAVLSLTITLLDLSRGGAQRLMYQKKYYSSESIQEKSPGGFARAASVCMARLSSLIITDVYAAVQGNAR